MKTQVRTIKKATLQVVFTVLLVFMWSPQLRAQALMGTKQIPGTYSTIAAAVADLNANGVGSGGVTFDIAAGYTETIATTISVTATGTASDPIVFQKSGVGTNPLITAYVGTNTPGSATQDGIWRLVGSDYVTIDGIDLNDPNTANPATMEYGYALYKASATNGAQHNTIKNCVISLSIVNNQTGSGPAVEGSRGIDVVNATSSVATTALSPTVALGANSFNSFYSNTIKNCNVGISIIGYAAASPFTAADINNDIGGSSALTGNTIINFGGASAAANPAAGIRTRAQYGLNISYNTVNNNDGAGVNHPNTLRGIYVDTATSANASITFNTITVKGAGTTSAVAAIENAAGSTASSNTINITNNTIQNCEYLTATSGALYGIYSTAAPATTNINNNVINNFSYSASNLTGTGIVYGIFNSGAATTVNGNDNSITNVSRTGSTGNDIYGIYFSGGTNQNILRNTLNNISIAGTGIAGEIRGLYLSGTTVRVDTNLVSNLMVTKASGTGAIYGIYNLGSPTNENYNKNQLFNLNHAGAGIVGGINTNTAAGTRTVANNTIYGLSNIGANIFGIRQLASTPSVFGNKLYNFTAGGTAGTVHGIIIASAPGTSNFYNNIISDLKAPASNTIDAVRAINITSTSTSSTINVSYNTIYLNATSTGTDFGSAGVYHTANSTATTAALNMRNNIIVNTSTAKGTGFTSAYRRSSTILANYAATSNNNLFYAGTPTTKNTLFFDGTNSDSTLALFKARMATRDQASASENPNWVSTTASSPNFLSINTTTATQIESGAISIAGITTDFNGNIRQGNPGYAPQANGGGTAPDLGAWEFDGVPLAAPVISGVSLNPGVQCLASPHTVNATIINTSGSLTSVVVNYSINGVAQSPLYMSNTSGNSWTATIPAATPSNANVSWSITADNSVLLSSSSAVSTYADEPLNGVVTAVYATVNPACSATPVQLSAIVGKAGATATIGAGATTTATYPNPFYSNWSNTHNQYLITAAELRAGGLFAGNITSLAVQITVTNLALNDLSIKMAHTTATNMSAFLAPAFTNVYSTALYNPVVGVNTMNFTTPFNWDGISNVVIEICHGNSGSTATVASTAQADATSYVSVIHTHKSAASAASATCIDLTTNLTTYSVRPKFIFGGNAYNPVPMSSYTWSDGATTVGTTNPLTVSPLTTTNYTFTATDANGCMISLGTPHLQNVINTSLSGIINVGTGQTYTTLTSAINAYNNICGLSGPVVFQLTDALYSSGETFPLTLNNHPQASATNTLTIKPAPGNTVSISGSSASSIINLNAAKYVTIDGSNSGINSRNLTVTNTNTGTSSAVIWAQNSTSGDSATHNTISNVIVNGNSNTTTLAGIGIGGATISSSSLGNNNNSNTIRNCRVSKVQYGIYSQGASVSVKNQNNVIDSNELNVAGPDNIGLRGILAGFENNLRVVNNKVGNITNTLSVMGISLGVTSTNTYAPTGNEVTNAVVSGNSVGPVTSTDATSAFGIAIPAVTSGTNTFTNNVVFSVKSGATPSNFCAGIYIGGGTGSNTRLYFNSVSLTDAATRGTPSAYAIAIGGTDPAVELKNNIFYNTQTTTGAGNSYAIGYASTTFTNLVSDYNLYYTSGANAQFAVTGGIGINTTGTIRANLAALKTATGKDANSISVDPDFASANNLNPYLGSPVVAAGVSVAGVSTDILGLVRNNPPAIGAYENAGDLRLPFITYTALPSDFNPSGQRVLNGFATITDGSGIDLNPGTNPRIYYKKKGDANAFSGNTSGDNGWKSVGATNSTSPFDFTIDYSRVFGGFVNHRDTIQYFVVAQDLAATPNVSANPATGFAGTSVASVTSAPASPNEYIIVNLPPLSGSYDIGTSQTSPNYATITAAMSDLKLRGVSSPVVFNLVDANYGASETFPILLSEYPSASAINTVTIKPATGINVNISGADSAIIKYGNKARYYIIDGSNNGTDSRNLTIQNTRTTANTTVIRMASLGPGAGVKHDVIKNCIIQNGSNTVANFGVFIAGNGAISESAVGEGNDSLVIDNNDIRLAKNGVYIASPLTGMSNFIKISNNLMNSANPVALGMTGVTVAGVNEVEISGNRIANFGDNATGANKRGIYVKNNSRNIKIFNNYIRSLSYTGTSGYAGQGVYIESATAAAANVANVDVYNNAISGMQGDGDGMATYAPIGIYLRYKMTGVHLYHNSINLYGNTLRADDNAVSIGVALTDSAAASVLNNIINNNLGTNNATALGAIGIYLENSATQLIQSDYNNIYVNPATAFGIKAIGRVGATNYNTLAAWKTAISGGVNSISTDPQFARPDSLVPGLGTGVTGGGVAIAGVTMDILGLMRNTPPSIGAYENGTDLAGPTIVYTALQNDINNPGIRQLTGFASITDYSGVNVNSGTSPRIYYKKKGNANVFGGNSSTDNGWKWVEATNTISPFDFTIDYGRVFGGFVNHLDTIQYFVTAQDLVALPNVSANPAAGFSGTSVAATSAPSAVNEYIIVNLLPLNGPYDIGASQTAPNYATITTAMADLKLRGASGPVVFNLVDAAYGASERFPVIIEQYAGASDINTVTIKPAPGVNAIISGKSISSIIQLKGADYVIIDGSNSGGTSRNLTISNDSNAVTTGVIWITSGSATDGANDNVIRNTILSGFSGSTTVTGIISGSFATAGDDAEFPNNHNIIENNSFTKVQNGMYLRGNSNAYDSAWIVRNNIMGSTTPSEKLGFRGMLIGNAKNFLITKNSVMGVSSATTSTSTMIGIQVALSVNLGEISSNSVSDIKHNNTSTGYAAIGIVLGSAGTTSNVNAINNAVWDIAGYGSTTLANNGAGIAIIAGGGYNLYHNSVNMSTSQTLAASTTSAIYIASAVSTASSLNIRNNIFANNAAANTRYAIYSGAPNTVFADINYNNYYSKGTSIGYLGSARNSLAAWQTATGKDANSISVNPQFARMDSLIPELGTGVIGGGVAIAGITTDMLGLTRNTPPSIGAYENGADLRGPVITYTTLPNHLTAGTATNRVLTAFATTTDYSGVNVNTGSKPRLYYKKITDNSVFIGNTSANNGWKWVEATNSTSPFDFTIDYSLLTGGGVNNNDVIQYFVVAQDNSPAATLGGNPSAGLTGTSVSSITTEPGTPNQYTIVALPPLNGAYTIGAGQVAPNYTSITAALNDLNLRGVSGPVTFNLADASYSTSETFPITITPYQGASAINTLTIKPASGINATVSGSAAAIFKLDGADYVTIDGSNNGSAGRNLTLVNNQTSANTAVIWVASNGAGAGAANNTIKNTIITGGVYNTTQVFGIFSAGQTITNTADGADNDTLTIQNNVINRVGHGIYAKGITITGIHDKLMIAGNIIGDSVSSTNTVGITGIYLLHANDVDITGNVLLNIVSGSTDGSPVNSDGPEGILLEAGVKNARVTENLVSGVVYMGTGGWGGKGIDLNTGDSASNIILANNMVTGISGDGYNTLTADAIIGIRILGTTGEVKVYNNTVLLEDSTRVGTTTASLSAAFYAAANTKRLDVRNNIFVNTLIGRVSTSKAYAVATNIADINASNSIFNYNNYYVAGTQGVLGYKAVDVATISDWRNATAQDQQSANASVVFARTKAGDLHLGGASMGDFSLRATPLLVISTDIDGDVRHNTYPYMGADESVTHPLPVKLLTLTAVAKGDDVLVSWVTASETNNKGFDVERSVDGNRFIKVDFVKGAGNSNRLAAYNLKDDNAFKQSGSSVLYYRLRQHDFNGNETISDVVMVNNKDQVTATETVVYPNPFGSELFVSLNNGKEGTAVIQLTDISGRVILNRSYLMIEGNNNLVIDNMGEFSAGVYFITIVENDRITVKKLVKH